MARIGRKDRPLEMKISKLRRNKVRLSLEGPKNPKLNWKIMSDALRLLKLLFRRASLPKQLLLPKSNDKKYAKGFEYFSGEDRDFIERQGGRHHSKR